MSEDLRIADLDRKAASSRIAARWAEHTHAQREGREGAPSLMPGEHFAQGSRFGSARIATTSDGVGTKVELAERTGRHDTLGFDLVAMVSDDLAAAGAVAANLTNVLDVDRIDVPTVDALMRGLHDAAIEADMAVVGGEIAELGPRVGGWGAGMHFNWCATAIGYFPEGLPPLTGAELRPGDAVIALRSRGCRSNGFSLLRSVLACAHGEAWHEARFGERTWGEIALSPSRIYAPLVASLRLAGTELHGIAHVTGGGIPHKLGRVLRASGLGATLDQLFEPQDFFLEAQRLGKISDLSAYRAWNMGQGMLLVGPESCVAPVLDEAQARGVEARRAGTIREEPGIFIDSRGVERRHLDFAPEARP